MNNRKFYKQIELTGVSVNLKGEKKKMQIPKTKKLIATLIIVLLMASAFALFANTPVAEAQPAAQQPTVAIPSGATDYATVETIPHVSFRPRTIGIGQPLQ